MRKFTLRQMEVALIACRYHFEHRTFVAMQNNRVLATVIEKLREGVAQQRIADGKKRK